MSEVATYKRIDIAHGVIIVRAFGYTLVLSRLDPTVQSWYKPWLWEFYSGQSLGVKVDSFAYYMLGFFSLIVMNRNKGT